MSAGSKLVILAALLIADGVLLATPACPEPLEGAPRDQVTGTHVVMHIMKTKHDTSKNSITNVR